MAQESRNSFIKKIKNWIRKTDSGDKSSMSNLSESKEDKNGKKLAFLFCGSHGFRYGMGQRLYEKEPVFRESVERFSRKCGSIFPITEYFENKKEAAADMSAMKNASIIQAVIHYALVDLWRSKGVYPDAVVGCSTGDPSACYANEALGLDELIRLSKASINLDSRIPEQTKMKLVNVRADAPEIDDVINDCPVEIKLTVQHGPESSVVSCKPEELPSVKSFLERNEFQFEVYGSEYALHTLLPEEMKDHFIEDAGVIKSSKPKCDTYLSFEGGKLFNGAKLDAHFWYWVRNLPAQFYQALTSAIEDGCDTIILIGPGNFLKPHIEKTIDKLNKNVTLLDSLSTDEDEIESFSQSLIKIKELGFVDRSSKDSPEKYEYSQEKEITDKNGEDKYEFDPLSKDVIQNPYPHYETLRKNAPVQFLENKGYWIFLNYSDISKALKSPEIYSNSPGKALDFALIGADPPDHTRVRNSLIPFFSGRRVKELGGLIEKKCQQLIDDQNDLENFDIVSQYAAPITEQVMGHVLGFPREEIDRIVEICSVNRYQLTYTKDLEIYFNEFINTPERVVKSAFCDQLLNGNNDANLSKEEVASLLKLFWVGGTTTTSMLISSAMNILLSNRALYRELVYDQELLPQFIEEVLRFESPEITTWRMTTRSVNLGDVEIPKSSHVRLCLASANRDPEKYDSPYLFDIFRNPRDHLAFGGGAHFCIGAMLARMEAQIALEFLIKRFRQIKSNSSTIEYVSSDHFRAISELRVSLSRQRSIF